MALSAVPLLLPRTPVGFGVLSVTADLARCTAVTSVRSEDGLAPPSFLSEETGIDPKVGGSSFSLEES